MGGKVLRVVEAFFGSPVAGNNSALWKTCLGDWKLRYPLPEANLCGATSCLREWVERTKSPGDNW